MKTWSSDVPADHWPANCVNVKDRIVLDLGCGNFSNSSGQNYSTTVEHWIGLGAKKVIGIDVMKKDIEHLTKKLGSSIDGKTSFFQQQIDSPEQVSQIINSFNIDVVKADIEGAEIHILNMSDEQFSRVSEYYIETHSDELFDLTMEKLRKCHFVVREALQFDSRQPQKVCVIFASKTG